MSKNKAGLSTGLFCYHNAKDHFWQWKFFRGFYNRLAPFPLRSLVIFFIDEFVLVI